MTWQPPILVLIYYKSVDDNGQTKQDEVTIIIREIIQRITIAKKFLLEFLKEDDRKETFYESVNWSVQREAQVNYSQLIIVLDH